jgi:galactose mutarotase-like enzyme
MVSVTVDHASWGDWPSVRLATPSVALEVVAELGARVVSLRDREREREWLLGSTPPSEAEGMAWSAEEVVFGGRESFGWDECLPTVAPCSDPSDPLAAPLRDHGDQWGRGAYVAVDEAHGALTHTWSVPRWPYRLSRRLSFEDGRTVLAEYELRSLSERALPLLWSQHPVFRLEPGCRIELPGVARVTRTSQAGIDLPAETDWPVASPADGAPIDLSRVQTGLGWSAKLYAEAPQPVGAVAPDGARLEIDWHRGFAPVLGIWLSYGGWPPSGPPVEQVALEPTTSAHDDLASARADGRERMLEAGARLAWWVRLRLS